MMKMAEHRRGAASFGELARKRWRLEQRTEERIEALLETLEELQEVDREQRRLL